MKRKGLFTLLVLLVSLTIGASLAQATDIKWQTVQLRINGVTTAKTLATVQDTCFAELPGDIAQDWNTTATAASYPWARITFVVTGAGVVNADSIRYQLISQSGGTRSYVSLVEQTAAVGNVALTHGGRVFVGLLMFGQTAAANATAFPYSGSAVLKIGGDPNGALNSIKAYLTYPARAAAK